jgi:hypothetical protein
MSRLAGRAGGAAGSLPRILVSTALSAALTPAEINRRRPW